MDGVYFDLELVARPIAQKEHRAVVGDEPPLCAQSARVPIDPRQNRPAATSIDTKCRTSFSRSSAAPFDLRTPG